MRYNAEVIGCVIPHPSSQDAGSQNLSHVGTPEIKLALGACKAGRHKLQGDSPNQNLFKAVLTLQLFYLSFESEDSQVDKLSPD